MRTFPDARFIRRREQDDYAFLSDICPTGWHCTRLTGLQAGESIAIYGAAPVGLMAALSAMIQGASEVMVDRRPTGLLWQVRSAVSNRRLEGFSGGSGVRADPRRRR